VCVLQEQQRSGPSYNLNHIGRFENELFPIRKEFNFFYFYLVACCIFFTRLSNASNCVSVVNVRGYSSQAKAGGLNII